VPAKDDLLLGYGAGLHPAVLRMFVRRFYRDLGRWIGGDPHWFFNNYGYAWPPEDGPSPDLGTEDEPSRLHLQLYRRTILGLDLSGRAVLEVGAGRAGGARHLVSAFGPKRYVAFEGAAEELEQARSRPLPAALELLQGDAIRLPFVRPAFDAVISVEAAHAFGDDRAFLTGAARALKKGGELAISDLRNREEVPIFLEAIGAAGFESLSLAEINGGVCRALEERHRILRAYWAERLSEAELAQFGEFFALPGSRVFAKLAWGAVSYFVVRATASGRSGARGRR
jgi:SAM-dependent methyltransferase